MACARKRCAPGTHPCLRSGQCPCLRRSRRPGGGRLFRPSCERRERGSSPRRVRDDISGVVAGNALWRMSQARWVQTFRDCLESPDRSHWSGRQWLSIFGMSRVDWRSPLLSWPCSGCPGHPGFLAQLARTATDAPPALPHRFFAARWERQEVDLKKGVWSRLPIWHGSTR